MAHNLINKGWSNMEALLDKELPVKKKKNKLLYWILLGIGLIIVLALTRVLNLKGALEQDNHNTVNSNLTQSDQMSSQNNITIINPNAGSNLRETTKANSSEQQSKSIHLSKTANESSVSENSNSSEIIPLKSNTKELYLNTLNTKNNLYAGAHIQLEKNPSDLTDSSIVPNKDKAKTEQLSVINQSKNNSFESKIQNESMAQGNGINKIKAKTDLENNQLLRQSIQDLQRVPSFNFKKIESESPARVALNYSRVKVSQAALNVSKNSIYFSLKAFTFEFPRSFEVGYNHDIFQKSGFTLYGSLGVLLNAPSIDYVSDQFDLDPVFLGGTSIGSEAFADVLKNEYFTNIGFSTNRNYAAKLGLGLELKLTEKLSLRNEGALYYYINSNVAKTPITNNPPSVVLKQNRFIVSNLATIGFKLSTRSTIYAGYQFSLIPEYTLLIEEEQKYSKSKEIFLGTQYLF